MTRDNLSLDGKSAIITGSGRENGIGAAIAKAFARNGARVAIHYVSDSSKPRAERVAKDIADKYGAQVTVLHGAADVPGTSDRLVKGALAAFDIDILVNNSGVAATGGLLEATPEQLQYEFGLNVFGAVYMTQLVVGVGKMPAGGRIVNIGTVYSKMRPPKGGSYAASKQPRAVSRRLLPASRGITVNTLAPGPIPTDTAKSFLENSDGSASAIHDRLVSVTRAANRMGTLEDIANAALLIVSEKARWVTAQFISVSGGIPGTM
ncbi:hypothetical protein S7711_10016 [Stachybotrys chartarum IBT 7711]|uniref:Uncharacterized protein n=1 Tax=Stachybotrys chartarum (strain CBS 109288 / IBT 7711) TaxID=1280523 RepID=A0A084AQH8_STACB|nr:hypothetical protein S7711_10016 [Stachybotrys chartarum IBT 7711]